MKTPKKLIPLLGYDKEDKTTKNFVLVKMDNQMAYIYRVSVYSSKRHTKSHTDMYYLKAEHTHWALEDEINYDEEDRRVHYIQVRKDSSHYASAVYNSQLMDKPLNTSCIGCGCVDLSHFDCGGEKNVNMCEKCFT